MTGDDLPAALRQTLVHLATGEDVGPDRLGAAADACAALDAPVRDVVLGSILTASMMRGPRTDDVVSLLSSFLSLDERPPVVTLRGGAHPVVLLSGSGKKGRRTLNVSTPAALAAAAAGARVVKVGSSATSSALGSRDLVSQLGIPESGGADDVRANLARCGFAFVPVEPLIPRVDRLYGGRFHTINPLSFGLAPLASPVRGDLLAYGLSHPRVDVAARALASFGVPDAIVFSTRLAPGVYVDELVPGGELLSCRVVDGAAGEVERERLAGLGSDPRTGGLPAAAGAEEAVRRTRDLLEGGGLDSHRRLVAANAGFLLALSGLADSVSSGARRADEILRSGAALDVVAAGAAGPF